MTSPRHDHAVAGMIGAQQCYELDYSLVPDDVVMINTFLSWYLIYHKSYGLGL